MNQEKKFSYLFYNAVTYAGVMISLVIAAIEAFLFALDFFSHGHNLYLGLITYLILPGLLIFGLTLIPLGVFWKKSRIKRGLPAFELRRFRIDLSLSHHRNALLVFIVGTALLMLMSLVGAYKAFHYTESVKFCGVLCHQVMLPEFTAYSNSPHGRVKCVECHIGAGADWYMHSKLSGARQVLKVLTKTYKKPIQTPVKDLRPAEETCKQCHWPGKSFSTLDFNKEYFLTEGDNRRWKIRMLLNIGSGKDQGAGVHAHMNLDQDIYYAAEDEKRQKITWTKTVGRDGKETVYVAPGSQWKDFPPPPEKIRKMDCIDCHNRPTHQFQAPYRFLNSAMRSGEIDPAIPKIKEKTMELVSKEYRDTPEATAAIEKGIREFYQAKYPDFYASDQPKIDRAIDAVIEHYKKNLFPEMKTRWDTHPDNIGHLLSPGCFRCHDGQHASAGNGGKVISRDCKACHLIVEQGPAGALEKSLDGLEFKHPDGGEEWKEMDCVDCHTGGA